MANAAAGEPGALYADDFWTFVSTSSPSTEALGITYGPSIVLLPPATGEPGNAPASKASFAFTAVILPSGEALIFMSIFVPDVGPVPSNTSALVIVIFTGAPDFFESKAATGSK